MNGTLFLRARNPFFHIERLRTIGTNHTRLVFKRGFRRLLTTLLNSFPRVPTLPNMLFVGLTRNRFLTSNICPIIGIFLCLLSFLTRKGAKPFPNECFINKCWLP